MSCIGGCTKKTLQGTYPIWHSCLPVDAAGGVLLYFLVFGASIGPFLFLWFLLLLSIITILPLLLSSRIYYQLLLSFVPCFCCCSWSFFLVSLVVVPRCSGRAEPEQKNAWLQTPGKPLRGLDVIGCDAGCLGKVLREATFKGWLKHTVDVVGPCWGRSLVKTPALSHVEFSHWQVPISV